MPKLKSHQGIAKRVRRTRNGKLLRRHAGINHMLEKKSKSRKRTYGRTQGFSKGDGANISRLMGDR